MDSVFGEVQQDQEHDPWLAMLSASPQEQAMPQQLEAQQAPHQQPAVQQQERALPPAMHLGQQMSLLQAQQQQQQQQQPIMSQEAAVLAPPQQMHAMAQQPAAPYLELLPLHNTLHNTGHSQLALKLSHVCTYVHGRGAMVLALPWNPVMRAPVAC